MRRSYSYKPGDIFEVVLENDQSGYFQYLTRDCTQLNSEVIRIFSNRYSKKELPAIDECIET